MKEQQLREALEKCNAAHAEYIKLLGDELDEIVPLAAAHGWASSNYARGNKLRDKICEALADAKQALAATACTWTPCSKVMPTEANADWHDHIVWSDGKDVGAYEWDWPPAWATHWQETGLGKTRPEPPKE